MLDILCFEKNATYSVYRTLHLLMQLLDLQTQLSTFRESGVVMVTTKSTTLLSLEGLAHPCDGTHWHLAQEPTLTSKIVVVLPDYSCSFRPLLPAAERSSQVVAKRM